MRKNINFEEIEDGGTGSAGIKPGGYVLRVIDVFDEPDFISKAGAERPRIRVVYDIAEGPMEGFYDDDWGREHPYAHEVQFYYESLPSFFKSFYSRIEDSNEGFKFDYEPSSFMGKLFGAVIREEISEWQGAEQHRLGIQAFYSVDDIRSGRFKEPKTKDSRPKDSKPKPKPAAQPSAAYSSAEIPF